MSRARNMRRIEARIAREASARAGLGEPALAPGFAAGREDDALWFEAHPDARWRLRKAFPGEAVAVERHHRAALLQATGVVAVTTFDPAAATHILVEQLQPGVRQRIACCPPAEGPERDTWIEDVLNDHSLDVTSHHIALAPEDRATASVWAQLPAEAHVVAGMLGDVLVAQGKASARKATQ